jgi:proteasome accessory factor C
MLEAAPEDARDVVQRTLAKLEAVAGTDPASVLPVHVSAEPTPGAEHVAVLERAIAAGRQLEIVYHVPSRDQQSARVIDPRGVARVENVLYLDAWCNAAQDDRVFRLDRIVSVRELDTPVADPAARPRDLTGAWFAGRATVPVTLRLRPAAAWVVEYYPVVATRPGPDGATDVDLQVGSEEWLTQLALRLAPHATGLDPPELAATLSGLARETLGRYEDAAGTD